MSETNMNLDGTIEVSFPTIDVLLPGQTASIDMEDPAAEWQIEDADTPAETPEQVLIELAWGLIANAYGGNWDNASDDWRGAAERWRNQWLAWLPGH